jgi:hypothetical protein
MPAPQSSEDFDQQIERLALAMTVYGVRNTVIENYHAGKAVRSTSGDYSDVKVVTRERELAWNEVSRITDEEMKAFNIEVSNKIFTVLQYLLNPKFESDREEFVNRLSYFHPSQWDRPVMQRVDRSATTDIQR